MEHIEGLTDAFNDAFSQASQPMSLSPSPRARAPGPGPDPGPGHGLGPELPAPPGRPDRGAGQYGQFRSVQEIDPKYRDVFSYPYFNLIQSTIIDDALYSDKSIVVCAPTGSGKTVVFEMAIVQLLMDLQDKNYTGDFKIVYMAPVKALCTERLSEWYPKFTKLGHLCIEVTGDTDVDFTQLKPYKIIITTPEKWDMLTRRWTEFRSLVEVIRLFLIDEVHILNDESRGPVLEAVVSRMKTIEESMKAAHRVEQVQLKIRMNEALVLAASSAAPRVRFVAVSATVSNPEDVATWLGTDDKPAVFYKLGEECRPVKLKRVVEGYHCPEGTSMFKFDIQLSYKLWPIIVKYYNGKPTLIFCSTRKSVMMTAETLSRELTMQFNEEQRGKLSALAATIKDKKLQALVLNGVGCHHAGLLYEERLGIEHAFRQRDLPILVTTTTLAMGVNLPAHLVIIKCTQQYVNGQYQEYSISTVLQMIGRAGRPQFDTEATAVIMTRLQDKARYSTLVEGSGPLESYLHRRLAEHLNSEVALRTVQDIAQGVQWARSTFLHVRAARDPRRYLGLPPSAPPEQISQKMQDLCMKAMNGLASAGLITMDEACCVSSTEAGRMMSIYCLDFETMKLIMKISGAESLQQLLALVCESHELAGLQLRTDERRTLNALNRSSDAGAATVRYPMKGKINTRQMKFNCVIQAIFGCLQIPHPALHQESVKLVRTADRICKCMVAYLTREEFIKQSPPYFEAIVNAVTLAKCCVAHLWEDSPYVSRQLRGIGPALSTLLASAGKSNFMLIQESHPRDLERVMNKNAPAGNVLRKQVSLLPSYQLTTEQLNCTNVLITLSLLNSAHMAEHMDELPAGDNHKSYILAGDSENCVLLCAWFKDRDLILNSNGSKTYLLTRKQEFEHSIHICCISSTFVGLDVKSSITLPGIKPAIYLNTDKQYVDVNPTYSSTNRPQPLCEDNPPGIKAKPTKQTAITDAFKERKKRIHSNDPNKEIGQKRKRDCSIIEKFKSLKDSFGIESEALKVRLQKTGKLFKNVSLANSGGQSHNDIESHVWSNNENDHENYVNNLTEDMFESPKKFSPSKAGRGTETFIENLSIDQLDQIIDCVQDVNDNGNDQTKLTVDVDNLLEDIEKEMAVKQSEEMKLTNNKYSNKEKHKGGNIYDTSHQSLNTADIFKQRTNKDPYVKFSLNFLNKGEVSSSDEGGTSKKDGFNDHIRLNLQNFFQKESHEALNKKKKSITLPSELFQNDHNDPKYRKHRDIAGDLQLNQENKIMNNDNHTRNSSRRSSDVICCNDLESYKSDKVEIFVSDPYPEQLQKKQTDEPKCKEVQNNITRSYDVEWIESVCPEFSNIIARKNKTEETLPSTESINCEKREELELNNSTYYSLDSAKELSSRKVITKDGHNIEKSLFGLDGQNNNTDLHLKDNLPLITHDMKNIGPFPNQVFMEKNMSKLLINTPVKSQKKIEIIENVSLALKVQTTITENSIDVTKRFLELETKTKTYFSKTNNNANTEYEFKSANAVLKETNPNWDEFQIQTLFDGKVLPKKCSNDSQQYTNAQSMNKCVVKFNQTPKHKFNHTNNKASEAATGQNCEIIAEKSGNSFTRDEVECENRMLDFQKEPRIAGTQCNKAPRTVQSILQKYNCCLRRERDTENYPTFNSSKTKEGMSPLKYTKSRKLFRIQEMENVDIELPMFANLTDNNTVQSVDETISFLNRHNAAIDNEMVQYSEVCSDSEIQSGVNSQDSNASNSQDNAMSFSQTIDEGMFDPKCLLASNQKVQIVENISNLVLPPPIEFSNQAGECFVDDLIGRETSQINTVNDVHTGRDPRKYDINTVSPEATQNKEIETWTFSSRDRKEYDNLLPKTFQSFSIVRNTCSEDVHKLRGHKLRKYKFTDREKLRPHGKAFVPPYLGYYKVTAKK